MALFHYAFQFETPLYGGDPDLSAARMVTLAESGSTYPAVEFPPEETGEKAPKAGHEPTPQVRLIKNPVERQGLGINW